MTDLVSAACVRCVAYISFVAVAMVCASASPAHAALPTWNSEYEWQRGDGYAGWERINGAPSEAYGTAMGIYDKPGLWAWLTGEREYSPGHVAWRQVAPGTTRFASADVEFAYRPKLLAHHCLELAFASAVGSIDARRWCSPDDTTDDGWAHAQVHLSDTASRSTAISLAVEMPECDKSEPACSKWVPSLDPFVNGAAVRVIDSRFVLVDDDLPAVAAVGPFFDVRGQYVSGEYDHDLTISASDAGSGISSVDVDWVGHGTWLGETASCDADHHTESLGARVCPPATQHDFMAPTSTLPEGTQSFVGRALDVAGNLGATPEWNLKVDRTAPAAPNSLSAIAVADDGFAEVDASWDSGDDPPLADGTPGSGSVHDQYRFSVNGAPLTDWITTTDEAATITGANVGDVVELWVRTVDAVGRASTPAYDTVTVTNEAPEADEGEGAIQVYVGFDGIDAWIEDGSVAVTGPNHFSAVAATGEDGRADFRNLDPGVYVVTEVRSAAFGLVSVQPSIVDLSAGEQEQRFYTLAVASIPSAGDIQKTLCKILDPLNDRVGFYDGRGVCDLTEAETDFCAEWWLEGFCTDFYYDLNKSVMMTNKIWYHENQPDGTKANAFTHSYWVSLMVYSMRFRFFTSENGLRCSDYDRQKWDDCAYLAREFSTAHEDKRDDPAQMDLHNNLRGFLFAKANLFYYKTSDGQTHSHTDEYLCTRMWERARVARRFNSDDDRRSRRMLFLHVKDDYDKGVKVRSLTTASCKDA